MTNDEIRMTKQSKTKPVSRYSEELDIFVSLFEISLFVITGGTLV